MNKNIIWTIVKIVVIALVLFIVSLYSLYAVCVLGISILYALLLSLFMYIIFREEEEND